MKAWRGVVAALGSALVSAALLSGTATASTVPGPPTTVRGLHTDFEGERVTVGWVPPANDGGAFVTAYQVQASQVVDHSGQRWGSSEFSECEPPAPDQQCFPELTVVFSFELTVYETYIFRVAARNANGWGAWSATSPPFTVLPGDLPRVGMPRDLVAVPIVKGMRLRWRPPDDARDVSYLVEWSIDAVTWPYADFTTDTTYTITGLPRGTYAVRVRSQRYGAEYSEWVVVGDVVVPDRRQHIVNFVGLPDELSAPGRTVLVPCGLVTDAGQRVRTAVRWRTLSGPMTRGDIEMVTVRRRACGKVVISISGFPVTVWVTLAAEPVGRYAALLRTRQYVSD